MTETILHRLPSTAGAAAPATVCILSRKDLRNITRVPRMAKALSDAGFRVVVVALRAPVQDLREMTPTVEYIDVAPRPFTARLLAILNFRVVRRSRRVEADAAKLAAGGWRAVLVRVRQAFTAPFRYTAAALRCLVVAPPAALMLRKPEETFNVAWHRLSAEPAAAVIASLVRPFHQQRMTQGFARAADEVTRGYAFRVVQAHDNYALVAADRVAARDKAGLVYDAVELTEHRLATDFSVLEEMLERRDRRQEAAIFGRADAITTIGNGLSEWYRQHYPIAPPLVVRNCRYYWRHQRDERLRADVGVGPEAPLIVWFGGIYPQQGVETLIDVVPLLRPDAHLAIIAYVLPRWMSYFAEELPRRAAALGVSARVHFLPDRDPGDLVPYVSAADLGAIPRPSQHPNNFYSMPNKFLEMVMARLPVAVSRLGDIVDAVEEYDIGASFDERDLADAAAVINRMLDPEVNKRLKRNVMRAAEELNWEKESRRYVELIHSLTEQRDVSSARDHTG